MIDILRTCRFLVIDEHHSLMISCDYVRLKFGRAGERTLIELYILDYPLACQPRSCQLGQLKSGALNTFSTRSPKVSRCI